MAPDKRIILDLRHGHHQLTTARPDDCTTIAPVRVAAAAAAATREPVKGKASNG